MATRLPAEVADDLTRLVRRWHQLPLDQALSVSAPVRALIERYADLVHPGIPVPDLGPAALPDQLTVLAYDALAAARITAAEVVGDLGELRRALP